MAEADFPKDAKFDFALTSTVKRCSLGKSCQATCINRRLVCRVELGATVSDSLNKLLIPTPPLAMWKLTIH